MTMRAVVLEKPGPAPDLLIRDLPIPDAGAKGQQVTTMMGRRAHDDMEHNRTVGKQVVVL